MHGDCGFQRVAGEDANCGSLNGEAIPRNAHERNPGQPSDKQDQKGARPGQREMTRERPNQRDSEQPQDQTAGLRCHIPLVREIEERPILIERFFRCAAESEFKPQQSRQGKEHNERTGPKRLSDKREDDNTSEGRQTE
jgi:hypothetical protein